MFGDEGRTVVQRSTCSTQGSDWNTQNAIESKEERDAGWRGGEQSAPKKSPLMTR